MVVLVVAMMMMMVLAMTKVISFDYFIHLVVYAMFHFSYWQEC